MLNSQFWSAVAILSGIAGVVMGAMLLFFDMVAVKTPLMILIALWLAWLMLEPKVENGNGSQDYD